MKTLLFSFVLVAGLASAQTIGIGVSVLPVQSITVPAPTVAIGATYQFTATTVLSDGSPNVPPICVWSSATPGVATINSSSGLATAVSGGTSLITCTAPDGRTGSGLMTVSAAIAITSPTCGTPPCPLTSTTNGLSYSYTLTASGGTLPYTWSCPATCTKPGWLSINASTGVLSGTAATGTTTFTVKVVDSSGSPLNATLSVTLTVASSAACAPPNYAGPPTYPCGSNSSANPGQINYLFSSGTPAGTVNTSNSAIGPCSPTVSQSCAQWVSGDAFVTSWNTGNGAGNGGNIQLGGGTGTANTTNGIVGACPSNCVSWVSGNTFSTAWTKINLAGISSTIGVVYSSTLLSITRVPGTLSAVGYSVVGTPFGVQTWNSTTVATLMSLAGTQTGVTYLNQTACKPGSALVSGNGCQNSISEDTTIPGHVSGSNLITRVTGAGVTQYGKPIGNLTISGGDADHMISYPNGTYFWPTLTGGTVQPFEISTTTHAVQVVNSGCGVAPALAPGSAFSTGWLSDTRYYYMIGTGIQQADLTGTGCTLALGAPTQLIDLMGANVCPGITPFAVGSRSSFVVSKDDDTFTIGLAPGGQGSGDWIFSWSRTKGCSTVNLNTGQWWAFCTSSCTASTPAGGTFATGATNCWGSNGGTGKGIHDILGDGNGAYITITPTGPWTQGGCVGLTGSAAGLVIWQIGTSGNQWCANSGGANLNCGDHAISGIGKLATPSFLGWNYRTLSAVSSFTTFTASFLPYQDVHLAWPHNNGGTYDDTLPLIGNTDQAAVASLSGCTGAGAFVSSVYCPTYFNNVTVIGFPFATYPPGQTLVVSHTGACGFTGTAYGQCADQIPDSFGSAASIAVVSPKGDYLCWASSMWHQTGFDNAGMPRVDAYCVYLGHP